MFASVVVLEVSKDVHCDLTVDLRFIASGYECSSQIDELRFAHLTSFLLGVLVSDVHKHRLS